MKKHIYYKIIASVFCLFTLFGCTHILDEEPMNITTPQNFWVSSANAESALAGDYGLLKDQILREGNFMLWGDFTAMTFMDSQHWIVNYIEGNGNYCLAYWFSSRNWKNFYRAANWALSIEKHVSEMPDSKFSSIEEKNRIIGEAAFIRSLSYFYMVRIWGDVPIQDEVLESSDQLIKDGYVVTKPRENELKVLDYALAAANKSISLLKYSSPGDPRWGIQANKASAEALKTHITLWYASRDNGNPAMLAQAVESANSVINNSNASLIDYKTTGDGKAGFDLMCKGQSKTSLFEINVSSDTNEAFRLGQGHTALVLTQPFFKDPNTNGGIIISNNYYGKTFMNADPARANDVRKTLFFSDFNLSSGVSSLLKYSQYTQDSQSPSDNFARFSESNVLIFRLADIYLLRAEANMKLGNTEAAVADLNTIRSMANVPNYTGATTPAALTKAIFDERAIEFVGEGQSGFDRTRMNYWTGVSWENPDRLAKKGNFWPVEPGDISINSALVQTEYWQGKL